MIVTADELMAYLRLSRSDLVVPAFGIWNESIGVAEATVEVRGDLLKLVCGANTDIFYLRSETTTTPGPGTGQYFSYTISDLLSDIALAGHGWYTDGLVPLDSDADDLLIQIPTDVLGDYETREEVLIVDRRWMNGLISSAQNILQRYCSRTFALTEYAAEVHSGTGSNLMILDNYPVTTPGPFDIESLSIDELGVSGASTVTRTSYRVDLDAGMVWMNSGSFTQGRLNYAVHYKGGYPTYPGGLKDICLQIAAWLYFEAGRDPMNRMEKLGVVTNQRFDNFPNFPPGLEAKMALFRRIEPEVY